MCLTIQRVCVCVQLQQSDANLDMRGFSWNTADSFLILAEKKDEASKSFITL